ncbi:protein ninX [Pseudoalteromonas phage C7]|uniref:protein ninX n=1 Tax=Pseudoalteromonas phage C7 TaxID=2510494 RepID=UPI0010187ED0|nr:protein ninX [Pseudoalteromonas phage C7]QAY17960.1 protein ninX [Pseudoalteromonas phage C7]
MSNWQGKSDFEINKAVVEIDEKFKSCIDVEFFMSDGNDGAVDVVSQGILICTVNYLTDANYAWPIMLENGIAPLAENGRIYGATTDTYEYYEPHGNVIYSCEDKNPLRAAMIVYLEMNGVKP